MKIHDGQIISLHNILSIYFDFSVIFKGIYNIRDNSIFSRNQILWANFQREISIPTEILKSQRIFNNVDI